MTNELLARIDLLEKENQELKLELSGYRQAILEDKDMLGLKEENQELKKQLEEIEVIVGLMQKRNLISKFDKEYDEEDKKKNPNRDYAGIMPDAEEVYRRYYTMKTQQKELIKYIEDEIKNIQIKWGNKLTENGYIDIAMTVRAYQIILQKYKEIIGDDALSEPTITQ